jgi:crotonobetainyl-CoA:carnitine CoA-transferase CaiB-like acyl-CoA transferase
VSALWRYPGNEELLCDGQTVYPDHIAAHITASAVLAALIARTRTGRGADIQVAQADTALVQLGTQLVAESMRPGSVTAPGNADPHRAPGGVYACAGDDEWCAVTVRDDEDWRRLCEILGRRELIHDERFATAAQRVRHREPADALLAEWLGERDPHQAAATLQAAGIPAGPMLRLPQLLTDPQLTDRATYTIVEHELLPASLPATARAAGFGEIADPPTRPAPLPGQHTREICSELLGLGAAETDEMVRAGVLQLSSGELEPTPIRS